MMHQSLDTDDKTNNSYKAAAVLSMALIGMQDPIGSEMLLRSFNHMV